MSEALSSPKQHSKVKITPELKASSKVHIFKQNILCSSSFSHQNFIECFLHAKHCLKQIKGYKDKSVLGLPLKELKILQEKYYNNNNDNNKSDDNYRKHLNSTYCLPGNILRTLNINMLKLLNSPRKHVRCVPILKISRLRYRKLRKF